MRQSGLRIFLIDIQESPATVEAVVKQRGYTLPVLLDPNGIVSRAYGVRATPTVMLIDSGGFVRAQAVGPRAWDSPAGLRILQSLKLGETH